MAAKTTPVNSEYVENVINNVSSDIIRITEDKLRLKLSTYEKSIVHSYEWIGALGIVVTIALSMLTTDFIDKFGVSARSWSIFFTTCFVLSVGYFVYAIVKACKRMSIDKFVDDLKQ